MWLSVILLLPVLLYLLDSWLHSYWTRRGVFQPQPFPIFGHIRDLVFRKKPITSITSQIYRAYKDYGLVGMYSFYSPLLLVTKPELVKQVLITDFNSFYETGYEINETNDPIFGRNPFATQNFNLWKERRGLHVSTLTPSKLKVIPGFLTKSGRNMVDYIKKAGGHSVNIKEIAELYTMDAASASAYGIEPTSFIDNQNIFKKNARDNLLLETIDDPFAMSLLYPFMQRILSVGLVSKEGVKFFDTLTQQLIEQRKMAPLNRGDIIDAIIKADEKRIAAGKTELPALEKMGHVFTAYIDSYFTTSRVLRSFIIDLAYHPEAQDRLREEIQAAGQDIEDFDFELVQSLKYLQMAINETLRMHPPLLYVSRKCTKTTKLCGKLIEKGTKVIVSPIDLHWDSEYYPEPEKYRPERFESEENNIKGTFIPFGEGPRMCLGNRYALLVLKLTMVTLLLNFKIIPERNLTEEELYPDYSSLFVEPNPKINFIFQTLYTFFFVHAHGAYSGMKSTFS